jgi:sugar lactone lactonase YvrE
VRAAVLSAVAGATIAALGCGAPPERPCEGGAQAPHGIATLCGFAKPEDVVWIEPAKALLVSEMGWDAPSGGGAISLVDGTGARRVVWPDEGAPALVEPPLLGDPACTSPPVAAEFSAHGLDAAFDVTAQRMRVAVVAHGAREAVEQFDLVGEGSGLRLVWRGCVPLPPGTAGNDVAMAKGGAFYVTNYLPTVHGLSAWFALRAAERGEITGDVLAWSRERGWRHVPGSAASQPNGIAVSPDGATLFVAENGASRVVRMPADGARTPDDRISFATPGRPDNLSWSSRGTLLVVVLHPGTPGGWSLLEHEPGAPGASLRVEARDGAPLHSVTSADEGGGRLFFGSMSDDRIGIASPAGE